MTAELTKSFHKMCLQFIEFGKETWPDDELLPYALIAFNALEPDTAARLFEEHFGVYLSGLLKKETDTLFNLSKHPSLEALDIETKFNSSSAEIQEKLWTYVTNIAKFISMSRVYKHIPGDVLGAVTSAAYDLKSKLDSGAIDPKSINPYEIGKEVMEKFDQSKLDAMMKSFMSNPEVMETVMTQMTSMMQSQTGNVDLADMMKMMNGAQNLD
jgi:hypothetical protein